MKITGVCTVINQCDEKFEKIEMNDKKKQIIYSN